MPKSGAQLTPDDRQETLRRHRAIAVIFDGLRHAARSKKILTTSATERQAIQRVVREYQQWVSAQSKRALAAPGGAAELQNAARLLGLRILAYMRRHFT
jgi:hypothetical protein